MSLFTLLSGERGVSAGEAGTGVAERQSKDSRDLTWDARLNTGVPHVARVYDYWLDGKDNFAADRVAGEETTAVFPGIRLSAQANRAFLRRAVRYLAGEAGIRQFLDIGTGLPAATTPTRSPRPPRRRAGSSTSTTTRWCWRTPARC